MNDTDIRVLVVDDIEETRQNVKKLLLFETGVQVVGEASDGDTAIAMAKRLRPDCVLMDINMPGTDGIRATELIAQELPQSVVIIMSVQGEQEYLRKAMLAGARDFLTKPFSGDDLINTIREVWEVEEKRRHSVGVQPVQKRRGKVIMVFSAKGGVGKTTLAVNLAVSLAAADEEVVLMDLDLQFGDVPIMLNLPPKRTIADWIGDDYAPIDGYLLDHESGVRVLAAPENPEEGELVEGDNIREAIAALQPMADYLIIDTPQFFQDTVLQAFDHADEILLVATSDLPNLKNIRRCLDILDKLEHQEKARVVINRLSRDSVPLKELDKHLETEVYHHVPADHRLALEAANQGVPMVELNPRAKVSQAIEDLSARLRGKEPSRPKALRISLW